MSFRSSFLVLFLLLVSTAIAATATSTIAEESSAGVIDNGMRYIRGALRRQLGKPSTTKQSSPTKRPTKSPTNSPTLSPTPLPTSNTQAGSDSTSREDEWDANKAKWNDFLSNGSNGYVMQYQQTACCVYSYNQPYIVTVNNNGVVSDVKTTDGTTVTDAGIISRMKTVEQAFTLIYNSWPYAEVVTATYDDDAGYPTLGYVDQSPLIADDEFKFEISNLSLL